MTFPAIELVLRVCTSKFVSAAILLGATTAHAALDLRPAALRRPVRETLVEPCAADFGCVLFDGRTFALDPGVVRKSNYEILSARTFDRDTYFLIRTTSLGQPTLALVVRRDESRVVKLLGFERQVPRAYAALGTEDRRIVNRLVLHDAHRTFLTTEDPSERARAVHAMVDQPDDLLAAVVARDTERLGHANEISDVVRARERRLNSVRDGVARDECYRRPWWTSVLNPSAECGRLDSTYDRFAWAKLARQLTRDLAPYAAPRPIGRITACAAGDACVRINADELTLDPGPIVCAESFKILGHADVAGGRVIVVNAVIAGRERRAAYRLDPAGGRRARLIAFDPTVLEPEMTDADRFAVERATRGQPVLRRYLLASGEGPVAATARHLFRTAFTRGDDAGPTVFAELASNLRGSPGLRAKMDGLQFQLDACRSSVPAPPKTGRMHHNPLVAVKIACGPAAGERTARQLDAIALDLARAIGR